MPYVPADEGDPDRVEIEGDPNFGKKYENPPPHAVLAAAGGYDFCCECLEIERKQVLDEEGNPIADNDDPSETGFRTVCTPPPGTVELMNGFLEMSLATLQPALDFGALFINPDGDFQIPAAPDLAAPIDGMTAPKAAAMVARPSPRGRGAGSPAQDGGAAVRSHGARRSTPSARAKRAAARCISGRASPAL